ncbi:MAG: McrB family protein, partial [Pseudanabaena sp.]
MINRTEADRRFGSRTPDEVMAELTSLGEENHSLRQKLSEQPSQASLERLQKLETLQETWESERLQLKTRVQEQERALSLSRVEVSNLETLRNEKEAMEASNLRLRKALEDLRGDLALSIADDQKRSQFEHCAAMDHNTLLQKPSQLYKEITDLRVFAKDLRDRIALSQGKGKELYYSEQDIRAFLGGLAMSRLHILQGISGTGKTSMPVAFADAVGFSQESNYELIEVQAGWRDKQDLIGYFNAFEGRFVENEFLKAIYKAQTPFYRDQIYIVLLDEMNLSRPEQYFADFLSKLEQAELGKTPALKLQSDPKKPFPALFQKEDLLLPPNIWFIGTANQDETTLEFADKTYDRAHVMELHQQAKRFDIGRIESRQPVSYSALTKSFNQAKHAHHAQSKEAWDFINEPELCDLLKRFRLGWGNRLKRQVDSFVPVVVAAGGTVGEATDHIFATKILRKLRDRHDTPIDDLK